MAAEDQIRPQYAQAFRCIGSACTDTCCIGWQVRIDQKTYDKYRLLPELSPVLDRRISRLENGKESSYAQVNLESGRCPFLSAEGMCDIQKAHGAEYLSETCSQFPRALRVDDGVSKQTLLVSCPEAARRVLLDPQLLPAEEFGSGTHARYKKFFLPKGYSQRTSPSPRDCFWKLQLFSIALVKDRRYSMWQRLFILGMFCGRLQELASQRQPAQLPSMLDSYARMVVDRCLVGPMEGIQARPAVQLDVTWKFILRILHLGQASSFRESIADFHAGLPFSSEVADQAAVEAYEAAHDRYYEPMMRSHPFLLENYLTNYILQRGFLSDTRKEDDSEPNFRTAYFVMCTHLVVIRTMLIGIAGRYREQFGPENVVKLVQGFSKAAEHNSGFVEELAKFISDSGLNHPGEIATLLKD